MISLPSIFPKVSQKAGGSTPFTFSEGTKLKKQLVQIIKAKRVQTWPASLGR